MTAPVALRVIVKSAAFGATADSRRKWNGRE
jgi:hypothetical protein